MRQLARTQPTALVYGAAFFSSLVFGAVVETHPRLAVGVCTTALAILILRQWPILIWAAVLASSLLLTATFRDMTVFTAGAMTVYVFDFLTAVLICGAWAGGIRSAQLDRYTRLALLSGITFVALVLLAFYRTVGMTGLGPALQARHLFPLVLALALPFALKFRAVPSHHIATALALGSVALAIRALLLLQSGSQAIYSGTRSGAETASVLGVQRIFQTWEPFLAAAIGLILFAYVLSATKVTPVHYIGLGASSIPLFFGFFRVAWVLTAVLGVLVLFLMRESRRRGRIIAGFIGLIVVFVVASSLMKSGESNELTAQLLRRSGEITLQLDPYRAQEYGAVWSEIKKDALLGQGFGTEYQGSWTIYRAWAHNAYEWMWWRLGIAGLLSFLGLITTAFVAGLVAWKRLRECDDKALALGLSVALAFTALAANSHENFENWQTNLFIGIVLAQLLIFASRLERSAA